MLIISFIKYWFELANNWNISSCSGVHCPRFTQLMVLGTCGWTKIRPCAICRLRCAFWGFSDCAAQSPDCANSQIAQIKRLRGTYLLALAALSFFAADHWNMLPAAVRKCSSAANFRIRIGEFLGNHVWGPRSVWCTSKIHDNHKGSVY